MSSYDSINEVPGYTLGGTTSGMEAAELSPLQRLDNEFRMALDELNSKITNLSAKLNPLRGLDKEDMAADVTDYPDISEFEAAMYAHVRSINYAYKRLDALYDGLRV